MAYFSGLRYIKDDFYSLGEYNRVNKKEYDI